MEVERDKLLKEKVDAEIKEKSIAAKIEKCHKFMLRINEKSFYQGIRQVGFNHGTSMDDPRYDLNKDVVNGKLVPLGENADDAIEEGVPQRIEVTAPSIDEIIEP